MFNRGQPAKLRIINMLLLNLITGGIYKIIWIYSRIFYFNNLKSRLKLNLKMIKFTILVFFSSIFLLIIFFIVPEEYSAFISITAQVLAILSTFLLLQLSFAIRFILLEHYGKNTPIKISAVLTLFLNVFYLQYKINRLPETPVYNGNKYC